MFDIESSHPGLPTRQITRYRRSRFLGHVDNLPVVRGRPIKHQDLSSQPTTRQMLHIQTTVRSLPGSHFSLSALSSDRGDIYKLRKHNITPSQLRLKCFS